MEKQQRHIKRVVIMANDLDRLGGIGRYINQLGVEFHRRGYEVELVGVTPTHPSEALNLVRPEEIRATTLWPGLAPENWSIRTAAHRASPARRLRHKKRMALKAAGVARLASLMKGWGAETLIICTQVFGMEHLKAAGFNHHNPKSPLVVGQYHGSFQMCVETGDLRRVIRGYSEVEKFVCLTEADSNQFRRAQLHNATWIPNPVVVDTVGLVARENVVVSLARYNEQKSLDYLLRAWNGLAVEFPEWRLELYGEGPERGALQALIRDQAIPRANLMGVATDISKVLAKSKIHTLTSQYEGLPIAIVEASMAGVPSVAFDCAPGISDLITNDVTGLVVRKNDTSAFTEALQSLMRNSAQLAAYASDGVREASRFRPDAVMERWDRLIREIEY